MRTVVYVDMDGVLCDFEAAYKRDRQALPEIDYPNSREGFYRGLKPISDAISAMRDLMASELFEPYILTAPSIFNPLSYTEKRLWVEENLGFDWVSRLIISPNKSLLRGEFLIDDHDSGHGQEGFNGELLQFGTPELPDWKAVLARLLSD